MARRKLRNSFPMKSRPVTCSGCGAGSTRKRTKAAAGATWEAPRRVCRPACRPKAPETVPTM
jgi:hypothetical protein